MFFFKCVRQDFIKFMVIAKTDGLTFTDQDGKTINITIDNLNSPGGLSIRHQSGKVRISWECRDTDIPNDNLLVILNYCALFNWLGRSNMRLAQIVKTMFEKTGIMLISPDECDS